MLTKFSDQLGSVLVLSLLVTWFVHPAAGEPEKAQAVPVTGDGPLQFRVKQTRDILPESARDVLEGAHGGFTVDRRDGKGETYFALKEAGIMRISADLSSVHMLDTPSRVKNANLHNTTIWYDDDGEAYLAFPANNEGAVFTTDLNGNLIHTLSTPSGNTTFQTEDVSNYFKNDGKFVPTDVEQVDGTYYVTTGYSPLDYVLTGQIQSDPASDDVQVNWGQLAFGGKGEKQEKGKFGTGHGITERDHHLHVSDRKFAQIDRFDTGGSYLSTLSLPDGSYPCDVDFSGSYAVVPCLHGPDRSKGAPIYVMQNEEIVSTVMIKEDLGLDNFQHIHNAVLKQRDGKWYIIAQSWNPGDFVILEQVTE